MKHSLLVLVAASLLFCGKEEPRYTFDTTPVWSDEFDYSGLPDPKKWGYDVGGDGWGNNELEYYTKDRTENARVENGKLIIEARKEEYQGRHYTSARLKTKGKGDWTYGRIVVRAKLPKGRGTWPAIWTLASQSDLSKTYWPDNGEIDIMEHVGYDPTRIHATVHTKAFNHVIKTQKNAQKLIPGAMESFHDYAVEWTPQSIRAFIDGVEYFTFPNSGKGWEEWPFSKPQHLLLNVAVGGNWGGKEGIDDSVFPQKMEVEYVRVYGLKR